MGISAKQPRHGDAMSIKNEHIVWAHGKDDQDRDVVLIGLTETGLTYLRERPGMTLLCQPPPGITFADISHVVVFHEKTKDAIKAVLRASGMVVSEVN
jgi:hypothetical protein